MSILAMASAFALAPLAKADDEKEAPKPRPERPAGGAERGGPRGGDPTEMLGKMFDRIDADSSGAITLEELKAAPAGGPRPGGPRPGADGSNRPERPARPEGGSRPDRPERPEGGARPEGGDRPERPAPPTAEERFAKMDADKNNEVSKEEFIKAAKERFAGRGQRGGARPEAGAGKEGERKGGQGNRRPAAEGDNRS